MQKTTKFRSILSFLPAWVTVLAGATDLLAEAPFPWQDSTRVDQILQLDTVSMRITGPSADACFYMNGLVFLSNTKYHQKMIADHISFGVEKAYFVPLEYLTLESSRPLFPNDHFAYSPGGMSFSRDYRKVYFTKPAELAGSRSVEKIFEMDIEEGRATEYRQLPFTDDPSRYLHPAVSQDDSLLVFASDRASSAGGLDLFVCRKTTGGWSDPVNMGRGINTSGHEWYPFLDHRKNLYFSSSGHMGSGGYDLYICYWDGSGWSSPQNLTRFINTPGDELSFSIHPGNKTAVFRRAMGTQNTGELLLVRVGEGMAALNEGDSPGMNDLSVLFADMARSGYTSGQYQAAEAQAVRQAFNLEAMPLLSEGSERSKRESDAATPAADTAVEEATRPGPGVGTLEADAAQEGDEPDEIVPGTPPDVTEATAEKDPDRLNFRVQILSSTTPGSRPQVTVDGRTYETFEYYWKGAYRITVGEFPTVAEADAFRVRCRAAGFTQSFVAAFRGEERETDPSVFRNQ